MRNTMRAVVFVMVGAVLSILAVKYSENDMSSAVPMMDPAKATQPT